MAPPYSYAAVSVSNVSATFCQYEALKHVSFPMQASLEGAWDAGGWAVVECWLGCWRACEVGWMGGRVMKRQWPEQQQQQQHRVVTHQQSPRRPAILPTCRHHPTCPHPPPSTAVLQTLGKCAKMIPVMIWGT